MSSRTGNWEVNDTTPIYETFPLYIKNTNEMKLYIKLILLLCSALPGIKEHARDGFRPFDWTDCSIYRLKQIL